MLTASLSILSVGWGFLKTPLGQWVGGIAGVLIAFWAWGAWQKSAGRAEVRAEWAASVERAKAAIKADDAAAASLAQKTDDELSAALAAELTKRQEKYDALVKAVDAAGCTVSDDDARRVRP
jgi:hypothetical protein